MRSERPLPQPHDPMLPRLWRCTKWASIATVLAGLVGVPYLWQRVDEEIRWRVEALFADHYTGLVVRVGSAELVEGRGIQVRDLSIAEPLAGGEQRLLAQVDELFFSCDTSLRELATGKPQITGFTVRRPTIRAVRAADGSCSVLRLWPLPKFGDRPLEGTIENGTLELVDVARGDDPLAVLRQVDLAVQREPTPGAPTGAQPRCTLSGTLSGDLVDRATFDAVFDPAAGTWSLKGTAAGVQLSPELQGSLPPSLAPGLSALASLRAGVNVAFEADHLPGRQPATQFDVDGSLYRGRVDDPRLPYPLLDLKGDFRVTQAGFSVRNLKARNGPTVLELSCRQKGLASGSPLTIVARAQHLTLDGQLRDFLPPEHQLTWDKYQPRGVVDAVATVHIENGRVTPDVSVTCRGVGWTYWKFPYPLERATGTVKLAADVLAMDLLADGAGEPLAITGEIHRPGKGFHGWVEFQGRSVPLDEKLLAALAPAHQTVYRSLRPEGTFDVSARLWREDQADAPLRRAATFYIRNGALEYNRFAYPVEDIRGTIRLTDNRWEFVDLAGANDTAAITCTGGYGPAQGTLAPRGPQLSLHFTADEVPLDRELRDALPAGVARAWDHLRPRGAVRLASRVYYWPKLPRDERLSVSCRIEPFADSVSIEPVSFPYRMEHVTGRVDYRDGEAQLVGLRGRHDRVSMAAAGSCKLLADGGWRLDLSRFAMDRLRPNPELLDALPERLRRAILPLSLSGTLHLAGALSFAHSGTPQASVATSWDLDVSLQHGSLNVGVPLSSVQGTVRLTGEHDGRQVQSRGELAIDSLLYNEWQFTDVTGPLWIDDGRVLLGGWASSRAGQRTPRRIVGSLFGGRVEADARVTLVEPPRYEVRADVLQVDLAQAAQEALPGRQDLKGKVYATLALSGAGRGVHNLGGRGNIQVRDADVYDLPVMLALLKVLNLQTPDTNAFSDSDINFRLEGGHVYFDKIDFNGDAISLRGTGEMNFEQEVRLQFHSIVGRGEVQVPILREILGGASQQTMTIHVGGTLAAPETRFEPFPALNQALQQLQGYAPATMPRSTRLPPARTAPQ